MNHPNHNPKAYREALDQNDRAHQKTICDEGQKGALTHERYEEICEEARTWLEHLDWIHYRNEGHLTTEGSESESQRISS